MKKKIIASLLAVSMIFSSMSFTVLAEETEVLETEVSEVSDAAAEVLPTDSDDSEKTEDVLPEEDSVILSADELTTSTALAADVTDGWKSGKTGGSSEVIGDLESGVTIRATDGQSGKWSGSDDQYSYFAAEVDKSKDFTLTADMTVNNTNNLPKKSNGQSESNPHQTTAGIAVFDKLEKTANSVAGSLWAASKNDTNMSIKGSYRDNAKSRTWSDILAKDVVKLSGGSTDTPISLKITKVSNIYTVYCGDNSYIVRDTGNIFTGDTVHPALMQARNADVTFTNIKLNVDDRKIKNLTITNNPETNEFVVGTQPLLPGLIVSATYEDGTTEVLQREDYAIDADINSLGVQNASITKGGVSIPIQLNCVINRATKVNVISQPLKNEYFIGQVFNPESLKVEAEFLDGTKKTLEEDQYVLSLGGKDVKTFKTVTDDEGNSVEEINYEFIDANMANDKSVKVKFRATETTEAGSAVAEIPVTVYKDFALSSLKVTSKPVTMVYYNGENFNPTGLRIKAEYKNADGSTKSDVLSEKEYILDSSAFDNTKAGSYTIVAKYAKNENIKTSFDVELRTKEVRQVRITGYPITTYNLDASKSNKEAFDSTGLQVCYYYSSGDLEPLKVRKMIYGAGDEETVNADGLFDIDLTKFTVKEKSDAENPVSIISIIPVNTNFDKTDLPVTVKTLDKHYWKWTRQGESASDGNKNYCTIEGGSGSGAYNEIENPGVKATVASTGGGGKISTDQDGISFLYTRLNADENFRIQADITIKEYLTKPFDDESRAGQEAFGIMARDNILLQANDQFKADNGGETKSSKMTDAVLDENGEPKPANSGDVYCGNFVLVGGCSFTGYPKDPKASSFEKNRDINRINLGVRYGCESFRTTEVGSPTREIPTPTMTNHFFDENDKYTLTLEKINGGYKATCYDHQTGTTEVRSWYPEYGETLTNIDPDNIYVGFFCARYAKMEVENVKLWVTDKGTDLTSKEVGATSVAPKISVTSPSVSAKTDYNLTIKPSNKSGGYLTIKQDNKVIINQAVISKKNNVFAVKLNENSSTNFEFLYTPRIVDEGSDQYEILTSTADYKDSFVVTHNSNYDASLETIYVAPDGSTSGVGTKEDPLDLDTALGFVKAGQTIIMMDGVYLRDKTITVPETKSGLSKKRIRLIADEGAEPVIDAQYEVLGMTLEASYWDVKGIDFRHSGNNLRGFQLSGNNCVIEDCKFYDNNDTGFQLSRTNGDYIKMSQWPHDNLIKNCEVWNSADPAGINADGFGCKLTVGYNNVFEGCVSHHNLDDGWDLYTKSGTGPIAPVTLINCISYRQGYELKADGTSKKRSKGGHNGLKLGGESVPVQHYIKGCKTFLNDATGISSNSNPQLTARDCVSWKNTGSNVGLYTSGASTRHYNYDIKGIVSYQPGGSDRVGNYPTKTETDGTVVEHPNYKDYNYINGKNPSGEEVTEAFFKSLDMDAVIKNGHFAQDEDGNFITGDFLELTDLAKAKIAGVEGYEDPIEVSTDEPTTSRNDEDDSVGGRGGGSAKKNNSSNTVSSSNNKDESSKDESSKTDSSNDKTNSDKDDNTAGDNTTGDNATSDNTTGDNAPIVSAPVDNGSADKFADLSGSWAKPYVAALVNEGIVNGITENSFAPDAKITRGDFTVMLVKALGITSSEAHGFTDVLASDYYTTQIAAAKAYGIINGTSATTFAPKNNITRQDAVSIIARTLDAIGYTSDKTGDLSKFADASLIASYAKAPFEKLVGLGFINGSNGMVNPTMNISRGEAAKLIYDVLQTKKSVEEKAKAEKSKEESSEETTEVSEETSESSEETTLEETTEK